MHLNERPLESNQIDEMLSITLLLFIRLIVGFKILLFSVRFKIFYKKYDDNQIPTHQNFLRNFSTKVAIRCI
ncbi:hypothetical protein BpHYR1_046693 [Brachionus plicatilis]|uniref:Uncharacterized protein n=1 Tax=Brachionus plicatilis TaxID=10195 RepID=A0A3M7RVS8_BRAPC|nr:hypothetical protein BpHYR1_046693 [Brachionus plicatilis]